MSRNVIALLGLLAIGAAPAPEPIGLSATQWGHELADWEILPDGSIRYTVNSTLEEKGPAATPYTMDTRRTGPAPDRYRRVAELMAPGRTWLGKSMPCNDRMTDMPAGQVHWGAEVLAFDSGCRDTPTAAVVEGFHDANDLVKNWVQDAPITATRTVQ